MSNDKPISVKGKVFDGNFIQWMEMPFYEDQEGKIHVTHFDEDIVIFHPKSNLFEVTNRSDIEVDDSAKLLDFLRINGQETTE